VNKLDTISDILDIANFIGKALYGIATEREFTNEDIKNAINAISAAGKIGTGYLLKNDDEIEIMREFFKSLSEAGNGSVDLICSESEDLR
jgi:hypothetical protein